MDVDAIERQKKLEEAMQRAQDDEEIIRLEQAELRRKQHEEAIQRQKEHAEAIQRKKEREEQRNTAIKEASCRTAEAALKGVFAHFRAERAAEKQRNREVALCLNDVLNQVMAIGLNNTSLREGADLVDVSVAEPTALQLFLRHAGSGPGKLKRYVDHPSFSRSSSRRSPSAFCSAANSVFRIFSSDSVSSALSSICCCSCSRSVSADVAVERTEPQGEGAKEELARECGS
jgi:hypothetical protein